MPDLLTQETLSLRQADPKAWLSELSTVHRRGIDLSQMAIAAIMKNHWSLMQEEGHGSDLVFCESLGGPLRHSNVTRRSFKPILKRANLPSIRFHDLRHSMRVSCSSKARPPRSSRNASVTPRSS